MVLKYIMYVGYVQVLLIQISIEFKLHDSLTPLKIYNLLYIKTLNHNFTHPFFTFNNYLNIV